MNIAVIGFGAIGKRHVENIRFLGIEPIIISPFGNEPGCLKSIGECGNIDYAIIASPTSSHLENVIQLISINCKKILIEKPAEKNLLKAFKIKELSEKQGIEIFIAYNLRMLPILQRIKNALPEINKKIRLIRITVGQYLPEWWKNKDYTKTYNANRKEGGGVDLDLSHEIDYMRWLWGDPNEILFTKRMKISSLKIDSPDYFKGLYKYNDFIVDVELDYFRKKERCMTVYGENENLLYVDFIKKEAYIYGKKFDDKSEFDIDISYLTEIKCFLGISDYFDGKTDMGIKSLATAADGLKAMELLELEHQS